MTPWFLGRYSKRLDDEIQALEVGGYKYSLNEAERSDGKIVITVLYPLDGKEYELTAIFPENYPYFPFVISSPSFPSGRHKNPYEGVLCLLKDPQQNWEIEDTLAGFIKTQVSAIAKAHKNPEYAEDLEAHEAAQITGYFPYQDETVVFTGDWQISPECNRGYLSIGLEPNSDPNNYLRGAVLEVQDENKVVQAVLDQRLRSRYEKNISARWIRLPKAPKSNEPLKILQEAIETWPNLKEPRYQHGPDIVGILIPEEVEYNQYHENWIFLVRSKKHIAKGKAAIHHYLARSDRASGDAIQARVPRVSPISEKKVLVVGLGSLGSVFAWQAARAGIGSLHLIDSDYVQLGNTPRWMMGWEAVGQSKAEVLSLYLKQQYPFTKIEFWNHQVGTVKYSPQHRSDLEVLPQALEGVDLIVDATAEWCVSHLLSDIAREKGIPYVWATGTTGGWGGVTSRHNQG